jgi:hypothetical protein
MGESGESGSAFGESADKRRPSPRRAQSDKGDNYVSKK